LARRYQHAWEADRRGVFRHVTRLPAGLCDIGDQQIDIAMG